MTAKQRTAFFAGLGIMTMAVIWLVSAVTDYYQQNTAGAPTARVVQTLQHTRTYSGFLLAIALSLLIISEGLRKPRL